MKQTIILTAMVLLAAGAAFAGEYTEIFDQTYAGGSRQRGSVSKTSTVISPSKCGTRPRCGSMRSRGDSQERLEALRIEVMPRRGVFVDTHYPNSRDLESSDRHGHSEVEYTLTVPRSPPSRISIWSTVICSSTGSRAGSTRTPSTATSWFGVRTERSNSRPSTGGSSCARPGGDRRRQPELGERHHRCLL